MITIISGVLCGGYFATVSNNEINNKKFVLPGIEDLGFVLFNGLKYIFAYFLIIFAFSLAWGIIMGFIIFFLAFFFSQYIPSSSWLSGICCISVYVITFIILIRQIILPLQLNFLSTLKFRDFFNEKSISPFIKERKRSYSSYFVKYVFILPVLMLIIAIIIEFLTVAVVHNIVSKDVQSIITSVILAIIWGFIPLLQANLNGQIVKSKIKQKNKVTHGAKSN